MRFAIGEAVVDGIVDDDDFEARCQTFCPARIQVRWRGTSRSSSRTSWISRATG
jgi:hypothetical protein